MIRFLGFLLYLFGSRSYFILVRLLAPFNRRAGQLINGQKGLIQRIQENEKKHQKKSIWFHVSSLGEFEQGKPLLESLKKAYPDCRIVVTFFSPSGYELRKDDPLCDAVYYLPFESKRHAKILLDAIQPMMACWVKYDFWYCYLKELHQRNIPVFLVAAQFRPSQIFFQSYGVFKKDILKLFTFIFCQNQRSVDLLNQADIHNHLLCGDNRYDRVLQTLKVDETLPLVQTFKNDHFLLIAGSAYLNETSLLAAAYTSIKHSFKIIIAPHFIDEDNILKMEQQFPQQSIRYSQLKNGISSESKRVLIIDNIGLLSRIYRYGDAALIGGGFWENGLHNTLEAAAFGMPIAFGPKLRRFPEAQDLVQEEIGTVVENSLEFTSWLNTCLNMPEQRLAISEKSRNFVASNKGATEKVLNKILSVVSKV